MNWKRTSSFENNHLFGKLIVNASTTWLLFTQVLAMHALAKFWKVNNRVVRRVGMITIKLNITLMQPDRGDAVDGIGFY